MRRIVSWFLLSLATVSAWGAERAESPREWTKLVTANFELYSNARESEGRELLRELETFRHVVSRFLGLTNVQREPAMVFLFKTDAAFEPYKPRWEGKPRPISGVHMQDSLDTILALSRQRRRDDTMRVLFHEYVHLLTARQFRHAPVWVNEGVAEVFSTFESRNDRFDIGVAATNHAFFLQKNPPMSVHHLLSVGRDSKDYNERERAGKFYASSWLLAHHLLFARRGYESNVMAVYATLSATTTNPVAAFSRAFGATPDQLDEELPRYLKGGTHFVVRQTYPDLADIRPRVVNLRPGELDFAFGRLLQMGEQFDLARQRLERAAAAAPTDPRPHGALALLAWRQNEITKTRLACDTALRLNSRDAFVHFLASEIRFRELREDPPSSTVWRDRLMVGRRMCEAAIRLDPYLPQAHHLLAIYMITENPSATGIALAEVQQALRHDPQYTPARITWASLLAAQGNFALARQILAGVMAGPLPPELRENARRVAQEIEKSAGRAQGNRRR